MLVYGIGIVVLMSLLTGFMLVLYYLAMGLLKLAGLSRERRIRDLTPQQVKDQDEWWATLSRADKRAWNRRERRKWRYVALRDRLADEVTRRLQAWYDVNGKHPDYSLIGIDDYMWSPFPNGERTQIANQVWDEWKMSEWDDINKAPDRPPCAWPLGGVIDFHHPKPAPDWEPPKGWKT